MRIELDYDVNSGTVNTPCGSYVGCLVGLEKYEVKGAGTNSTEQLVELKRAGFTADEIIEMHRQNLIG